LEINDFTVHRGSRTQRFAHNPDNFVGVELESHETLYPGYKDASLLSNAKRHFEIETARLAYYFTHPVIKAGIIEKKIIDATTRSGKPKQVAIFTCCIEITEGIENPAYLEAQQELDALTLEHEAMNRYSSKASIQNINAKELEMMRATEKLHKIPHYIDGKA
jgi:hypothetical protein